MLAKPQRVPAADPAPTGHTRRRWPWLVAAAVLIAALATGGVLALLHRNQPETPESQVEKSIETFASALQSGDLAELRASSCGALHEYYSGIADQDFAAVYEAVSTQNTIPVITDVHAVQVSGDTAIAEVTAYTKASSKERTTRTVSLTHAEDGWKVCDPPS
ncbi:hypothetical protein SKPI104516_07975 [Skermania piniformis]